MKRIASSGTSERGARWRRASRILGALGLAASVLGAPALAETDFQGPYPWSYTFRAGPMFPSGEEGQGLDTGLHLGGVLGHELTRASVLGAELSVVRSSDDLRTTIAHFGIRGALSPSPDFTRLTFIGGLGAYAVFYNTPGTEPDPATRIRPGGSFGLGFDVYRHEKTAIGIEGVYHGIVMSSNDALSYVTLGLYLSLRPGTP